MNREIPGFYYDEEKKKYFRIQPNHAAPAGSAYSEDDVKRRKVKLEVASEMARNAERWKNHIRRASILQDPLLGGSISREHGNRYSVDAAARTYVQGWEVAEILQCERSPINHEPSIAHPRRLSEAHNSSTLAMRAFDFDPGTRSLFYPKGGGTLCEVVENKHTVQKGGPYFPVFNRESTVMLSTNHAPITSVNIDPETRLMLTTWREPNAGHNMHMVKVTDGEGSSDHEWSTIGTAITARIEQTVGVSPTLWSATHGAHGSPFVFVIAAEDGLITLDQHASLQSWMSPPLGKLERPSALVAVASLAQHPSVILGGARNGRITFLDVRVKRGQYQHLNKIIRHPSVVSKIKQLNENIIVVAGLNSTLCNYDLRFIQTRSRDKAWQNWTQRPGPAVRHAEVSNPVLVYPEHSNGPYMDLGFDIDPEAGIVAAVQDDYFSTLKIFSADTGHVLQALNPQFQLPANDIAMVKAVRFLQDCDGGHMKSLWVAKGTRMVRYAW